MKQAHQYLQRIAVITAALITLFSGNIVLAQNITENDVKDINNATPWYDQYNGCTASSAGIGGPVIATQNLKQFIDAYGQQAFNVGKQYGIPYEAIIAQAALESGYGKSLLTREAFNFFGIKAGSGWNGPVYSSKTQEFENGHYITITANFRKYANAEEGFRGYAEFIHDNSRYKPALQYPRDPEKYIQEVAKAGYATDPSYASKNISLIRAAKKYIAEKNLFPPSSEVTPDAAPPTSAASGTSSGDCTTAGGPSGPTVDRIIQIAKQELAKDVHEYDANTLKYTTGRQEAWCADFVSWVFHEAGVPFTGGLKGWQIPGVLSMQAWFKSGKDGSKYFRADAGTPQKGDVAFYIGAQTPDGGSKQHVNIVIDVSPDGKKMTLIGGNQSNRVTQYTQSTSLGAEGLAGFGRISK